MVINDCYYCISLSEEFNIFNDTYFYVQFRFNIYMYIERHLVYSSINIVKIYYIISGINIDILQETAMLQSRYNLNNSL